jgi:hypothetical protein
LDMGMLVALPAQFSHPCIVIERESTSWFVKGKVHPMTCLCSDREAAVHHQMIRSFGARRVRVISITPRPFYPGKDPVPIVQEAGWVSGPVWTGAENLTSCRDSIPEPSSPTMSRCAVCTIPAAIGLEGTTNQVCSLVTECRLCSCRSLMTIARPLQHSVAFNFCQLCAAVCIFHQVRRGSESFEDVDTYLVSYWVYSKCRRKSVAEYTLVIKGAVCVYLCERACYHYDEDPYDKT